MSTSLRITLDEYDEMIRNGGFDALRDHRIELINGELTEMNPPGAPHEFVVDLVAKWSFRNTVEDKVWVRIQNSIGLPQDESAPQPDVAWVKAKDYRDQRPQPDDVLLVIEVSHSSVRYDRLAKAQLYANAGIPEYWVIDIANRRIEVRRDPSNGDYGSLETYDTGEVSPLAEPSAKLRVESLF